MHLQLASAAGIFIIVALAWLLSANRWRVSWALVGKGLLLQLIMALLLFKTGWGRAAVAGANSAVGSLLAASAAGTSFVFGPLADPAKAGGFIIFVQFTGSIVFIAALSAGLYHLGLLQLVVAGLAKVMRVVLGTSGSESLAAAVNMFVGQDESALFIRPYLRGLTPSEIMALMTVGMSTIASGVLVTYAGMLGSAGLPNVGGHLLAASVLSAPASLVLAKILMPETNVSETAGTVRLQHHERAVNLADALCAGATEGFRMSLNIMAMLIAFVALIFLLNSAFEPIGRLFGVKGLKLETIFGFLFRPFAWLMGVAPSDAPAVGSLLGKRMILNEFLAYEDLASLVSSGRISVRSATIATYALCGFANFTSIAIQIGGIGTLEPTLRPYLARFGLRAMIGGTLSTFLSACLAGALL